MANQSPIRSGKRKALIIGISKYDHNNKFRNLDFCENDANEVYRILKDQDYDIPENRLLVERVEWSKMRDEIIKFFRDKRVTPDLTLFFYFSGHGYLDKNTGRTYLATSEIDPELPESRAIPFDELASYFNYSNSERIVVVLDCCYSGALEVGGKGEEEDEQFSKAEKGEEIASLAEANMRKTVERLIRSGQGRCILASSLEEQKSFKMQDKPYSLFTNFLLQGLKGANGESVDDSGYVTPELLGSYVNKKMLELPTIKQKPIRKIEVTGQIILADYPDLARKQQQQQISQRDYLLQLLTEGKVEEFNEIRRKDNYSRLNFYQTDLSYKDLSNADLRNSDFNLAKLVGAKLHHVLLVEATLLRTHLSEADLSEADLSGAMLVEANLSGAKLSKAKLIGADLSEANLSGAKLSGAKLFQANLSEADLFQVNLSGAELAEANLSGAKLSKADLSEADLSRARLSKADLSEADLSDANLANAYLYGAVLSNCDLSNCDLSYSNLVQADLGRAKLFRARLSEAYVSHARLLRADLSEATLIKADLSEANLSGANLSGAKLFQANLSEANLSEAILSGANLILADLSYANLASSIIIGWKFMDKKHYPDCMNAKFDNYTIIDDEKLFLHFHDNNDNPASVPSAVKDKKELREKLERSGGFNPETIDALLSFSSLPDSK